MRIAERGMQWAGTVAGVAAGCVWGDACVAEAIAAPPSEGAPAVAAEPQAPPAPQASAPPRRPGPPPVERGVSEEGVGLTVGGVVLLGIGVGTLVYTADEQGGMNDLADNITGPVGGLAVAAGLGLTLAGVVVLAAPSEGEGGPRVEAAVGPTWVGLEGTF